MQLRSEQETKRQQETKKRGVIRSQSNTRTQSVRRTSIRDKTIITKKDVAEESRRLPQVVSNSNVVTDVGEIVSSHLWFFLASDLVYFNQNCWIYFSEFCHFIVQALFLGCGFCGSPVYIAPLKKCASSNNVLFIFCVNILALHFR